MDELRIARCNIEGAGNWFDKCQNENANSLALISQANALISIAESLEHQGKERLTLDEMTFNKLRLLSLKHDVTMADAVKTLVESEELLWK